MIVGGSSSSALQLDADAILRPAIDDPASRSAARGSRARWSPAGYVTNTNDAFAHLAVARASGVRAARRRAARGSHRADSRRRRHRLAGASRPAAARRVDSGLAAAGLDALEAYHTNHDATRPAATALSRSRLASPAGRFPRPSARAASGPSLPDEFVTAAAHPGSASLPAGTASRQLRDGCVIVGLVSAGRVDPCRPAPRDRRSGSRDQRILGNRTAPRTRRSAAAARRARADDRVTSAGRPSAR